MTSRMMSDERNNREERRDEKRKEEKRREQKRKEEKRRDEPSRAIAQNPEGMGILSSAASRIYASQVSTDR